MIQKANEAPGMAKPKETQRPKEETKILRLNMTSIFIIFINGITSLQENTMELQEIQDIYIITLINEKKLLEAKLTWYLCKMIRSHSP